MSQKGHVLLIVLIIAAVIGGYFYFTNYSNNRTKTTAVPQQTSQPSPTADVSPAPTGAAETANWETYIDTRWNISFKYPKDWFIFTQGTAGIGDTIAVTNFDIEGLQQKGHEQTSLRINIDREKTDYRSTYEYIKSRKQQRRILSSEKITVAGIEAVKQEEEGLGRIIVVYVIKNGYAYVLTAGQSNSNYISIFDQILSSFKFTN